MDIFAQLKSSLADRYALEREIGRGGMATVYLADDLKHQRRVALKVLKPELAAMLGAERFVQEIRTTAALQHPHILPLFDSGTAGGFLFYVMPYIEGETVRDKLDREPQFSIDEALRITGEVADALDYAHRQGVIHRDIKPENILLSNGHALVADFGIARAVGEAGGSGLTATGTAIGTPAYMSPEQSAGESHVDGRSDQYALASVLYEMLAGEPPFTGQTAAAIISRRLGTPAPSARVLRAAVPAHVDRALLRALQRSPADRFATTTEFAAALQSGAGASPARGRFRIAAAAMVVVAVAVATWFGWRGGRDSAGLDPNVIAVLPFRVGGDASINYLRESMLDLLQARLTGTAGLRTVEPRTLLASWRRAVGNEREDLAEAASRTLARGLGAGRVLLGSAVATPTELTLSGSLLRVADGKELARKSVSGAPDSVAVLVNRLTAALLIGEAGEAQERVAGLAAAPLGALQDYLAGRQAARRGDYFGAMRLFGKAFATDSTFVEAAYALVAANAWNGTVFATAGFELAPLVARMRHRLSRRDADLMLAMPMIGPNFPRPSTNAEIIAQAERAANGAPDSPEHWLLLGQLLSHYGAAASRADWATRATEALDRAIALDSTFTPAIGERLFAAMEIHDRDATPRLAKLFEARVAAGFSDDFPLWAAARALGDSAAASRWRDPKAGLSRTDYMQKLVKIALHSTAFALPLADARWAAGKLQREASTEQERVGASLADLAVRFAEGQVIGDGKVIGDASLGTEVSPQWVGTLVQQTLIEPEYRPLAASVLADEAAGKLHGVPGVGVRWPPVQDCFGTLHRITGGDTVGAAAALRRLRAFAATDKPPLPREEWEQIDFRVCPLLLQLLLEGPPAAHEARRSLDELDVLMRGGPRGFMGNANFAPTAFANYTIARFREAQGDIPGALAAIRRRDVDYFPAYLWSLPAFLRQEGRLAMMAGDTERARRAYDEYLTLRPEPDGLMRAQRDSVIAERAKPGTQGR